MDAGGHLNAALEVALINAQTLHQQWIQVMHRFGSQFGAANLRMSHDARIDLLLRQLEAELLTRNHNVAEGLFCFDVQIALSEQWVLSSYEILRSCCQFAGDRNLDVPKLKALRNRFALVRIPIAKYEIAGTNKKKPNIMLEPIPAIDDADNSAKPYDVDGTYIMPRSICMKTGAIVWYPVDIAQNAAVPICRRDLSDEMLEIFD